jgi:DNA-binding IclR family transcriptional regulator
MRSRYIARSSHLQPEGVGLLCWIKAYERVHGSWPPVYQLAKRRGKDVSHVRRQVNLLIALGYVARVQLGRALGLEAVREELDR